MEFWSRFSLILIVTILLTVTEGKDISLENCGENNRVVKSRIIGGKYALPGEYPWIVSLHENNAGFDHVCGGTILNEHWIITAAHCIDYPKRPKKYVIYAGLHRLSRMESKTVQRHKISKIIMHEDYDSKEYTNDIALMKTKEPIDIKGSKGLINSICLPNTTHDPAGWAIVSGWGHTMEEGDNSNTLMAVRVPIVPRDLCNNAYDEDPEDGENIIIDTMFCAGAPNKDSCQNDSGGPLIQKSKNGAKFALIGVVSWGVGCGDRRYPGVYTKVGAYMDWIQSHID